MYEENGWNDAFPADLVDRLTVDGKIYSVPSNIHRANVVWANPAVLEGGRPRPDGDVRRPRRLDRRTWRRSRRPGKIAAVGRDRLDPGAPAGDRAARRPRRRGLQRPVGRVDRLGRRRGHDGARRLREAAGLHQRATGSRSTGRTPPRWSSTARPRSTSWATGPWRRSRSRTRSSAPTSSPSRCPGTDGVVRLPRRLVHAAGRRPERRRHQGVAEDRRPARRARRRSTRRRAPSRPAPTPTPADFGDYQQTAIESYAQRRDRVLAGARCGGPGQLADRRSRPRSRSSARPATSTGSSRTWPPPPSRTPAEPPAGPRPTRRRPGPTLDATGPTQAPH